tara:strand:+ start:1997 stop:2191 length:195 start_codon:yes stop_codon:yes gene_type:complete
MKNKPTHGNLVWILESGGEKVVMENRTWQDLGREKTRLEASFPKYYGNKKLGKLKSKYKLINRL